MAKMFESRKAFWPVSRAGRADSRNVAADVRRRISMSNRVPPPHWCVAQRARGPKGRALCPQAGGAGTKLWMDRDKEEPRRWLANLTPVPPLHPMERGPGGEVEGPPQPHPRSPSPSDGEGARVEGSPGGG